MPISSNLLTELVVHACSVVSTNNVFNDNSAGDGSNDYGGGAVFVEGGTAAAPGITFVGPACWRNNSATGGSKGGFLAVRGYAVFQDPSVQAFADNTPDDVYNEDGNVFTGTTADTNMWIGVGDPPANPAGQTSYLIEGTVESCTANFTGGINNVCTCPGWNPTTCTCAVSWSGCIQQSLRGQQARAVVA